MQTILAHGIRFDAMTDESESIEEPLTHPLLAPGEHWHHFRVEADGVQRCWQCGMSLRDFQAATQRDDA